MSEKDKDFAEDICRKWQAIFLRFASAVAAGDDDGPTAAHVAELDHQLAEVALVLAAAPALGPAGIAGKLQVALDYCCASPQERETLPWRLIEGAVRDLLALA
ncbi:MAG TPA: hypothetical protein VK196_22525 [Magnetospirillum sp.]|nr:hypothetical protein [Magnetospirillum sp.]